METPSKEAEAPTSTGSPSVDNLPTDPVEIRELIRKQIEYYFSKENLVHDAYLTSQMDAQMSAPISVIMKFGKIKVLTQDESVLKEALAESTAVTVIDNRIKSNFKPVGRSTIILRDIASDVLEEEVRTIFAYDGCKHISSIRKDIENTWFVIMDSEEDAKDTMLDLKLKKRTFRGESVKCRLKTEAVVKSYFPVAAAGAAATGNFANSNSSYMMPPYGQVDMRMYGYGGGWQQNNANNQGGEYAPDGQSSPGRSGSSKDASKTSKDGQNKNGVKDNGAGGNRKGQQQTRGGAMGSKDSGRGGSQQGGRNKSALNAKGASWTDGKNGQRAASFDISGMNFPPLAANETPTSIPQPGYSEPFIKYTHDDVINIVKNITDVVLPKTIEPERHSFAMTDTPNMDLLHRQRTFSIDETREQLRQGKPVQRDAVVSGAVDLESMYYGDAPASANGTAAAPIPANVAPVNNTNKGNKSGGKSSGGSWAGILMKSGPSTETGPQPGQSVSPQKQPVAETAPVPKAAVTEAANVDDKKPVDKAVTAPNSAAPAGEKKSKSEKKNKDGKRGEGRRGGEGSEADTPPSSWGGKPSFATILKQQSDADQAGEQTSSAPVAREEAHASSGSGRERTRSGSGPSTPGRKGESGRNGWDNRNKSGNNNKSGNSSDSKAKDASGAWVRGKLPSAQDKA